MLDLGLDDCAQIRVVRQGNRTNGGSPLWQIATVPETGHQRAVAGSALGQAAER